MQLLRRERKLTIEQAAVAAELSVRQWEKLEAAESDATLRVLERVAAALEVEPAALVCRPAPEGAR